MHTPESRSHRLAALFFLVISLSTLFLLGWAGYRLYEAHEEQARRLDARLVPFITNLQEAGRGQLGFPLEDLRRQGSELLKQEPAFLGLALLDSQDQVQYLLGSRPWVNQSPEFPQALAPFREWLRVRGFELQGRRYRLYAAYVWWPAEAVNQVLEVSAFGFLSLFTAGLFLTLAVMLRFHRKPGIAPPAPESPAADSEPSGSSPEAAEAPSAISPEPPLPPTVSPPAAPEPLPSWVPQGHKRVPPLPEVYTPAPVHPDDEGISPVTPLQGLYSPQSGVGWAAYLSDRLTAELNRATAANQDLVLALVKGPHSESQSYRRLADLLVKEWMYRDLIFEHPQGFLVIQPHLSLETALKAWDSFLELEEFSKWPSPPAVGLTSRNGRIIGASLFQKEAEGALERASSGHGPVVGFRSDPERYRQYLFNSPDGSKENL